MASLTVGAGVAAAGDGGINVPEPPRVRDVACIDTCAGEHRATEGSKVQVSGRYLGNVRKVLFRAEGDGRIAGRILVVRGRLVKARVPAGAADGRPKVVDRYENDATSPNVLNIVSPDAIPDDGGFKLERASAKPNKIFYNGLRRAKVDYTFSGSQSTDVRVQVVHRRSGKVADSWLQESVPPNIANVASWRPSAGDPIGGYRFKIGPASGGLESTSGARFQYYKFKFPVRGRHTYGDGYGAPRSGHTHMGQDVFSRCGARLVAARGGRVQVRGYHSSAGYYVVIDGRRDGHDYVYMHLRDRAPVREGERVHTGERIGKVGATGNASGCHLHFEYWSNDWWNGGRALPKVTRVMRRWDSWS